ncbi:MAG: UDP-3-O-(3-hydroxymyristoyl)glucosamine N-acyltransferase, partial [Candidatus Gastranaerophilales bacterium]|nr:UDP-3-O-(3-hydroxymyristoyl)glucosamine N-acyltransferase [Candidatus Gastranaerophilales bacterium]
DTIKEYTLEEISKIAGGILTKVEDVKISKLGPPLLADEETLALAINEEEIENLSRTKAKAAIVPIGVTSEIISTIETERPRLAMMKLLHLFYIPPEAALGIHPSATVHPTAKIGENVSIGANVVISRNVSIGKNTKILPNVYVGRSVQIGENCLFHPGCNIGDNVIIGNKVVLQHGVSIGADGFSFVTENPNNVETARKEGNVKEDNTDQKIYKIPSIGSVVIGDDVEIGANTCIDKGTIENTVIGEQTKIDNLVQIGHNCKIGKGCMIVSQVGIAGSCKIGDRVVIAGQAGMADHTEIGSDSIIMAKAGITRSFPDKTILIGAPAMPRKEFLKHMKIMKKVQDLVNKFKDYEHLLKE